MNTFYYKEKQLPVLLIDNHKDFLLRFFDWTFSDTKYYVNYL